MDTATFYFSCKNQTIKINKFNAKAGFARLEYQQPLKNEFLREMCNNLNLDLFRCSWSILIKDFL